MLDEHDDEIPEDDFPASAQVPGQAESRSARVELQRWLTEQTEQPAWQALWDDLCEERAPVVGPNGEPVLNERGEVRTRRRWDWRKALYIAWSSVPRAKRQPPRLEDLASLLGLASTGTIRNWRRKDPDIQRRIKELPKQLLLPHVVDVYDALVSVATSADPKAHPDRKLFLQLTEEYGEKGTVTLVGSDGGPVGVDLTYGIRELSDDDLDALGRIAERLAGDPGGAGAAAAD